jgi:spermidine synthase
MLEDINADCVYGHSVKEVYYSGSSEFQHVDVVNFGSFGKCLVIDGHMQSSQKDEAIYHECLVQPAMFTHPCPKRVFIAGGGEGATAREILRHKSVTELIMVDIDDIVITVSKKYLPQHHNGAFEDPRMKLIRGDAKVYLEENTATFDVVIMDLPDPQEQSPASLLYTQNFYKMLQTRLSPGGVMLTQSGPGGPLSLHESFSPIYRTLSTVFKCVHPYFTFVPSVGDCNGWTLASDWADPRKLTAEEIDKRIADRLTGGASALQFYDGSAHLHLFHLPKWQRLLFEKETSLITEDNPTFCFQHIPSSES